MVRDFFDGITSYFQAFRLIGKLRLWKFVLVPGLISLFLGGLIGFLAWWKATAIGNFILSWYPWEYGSDVIGKITYIRVHPLSKISVF